MYDKILSKFTLNFIDIVETEICSVQFSVLLGIKKKQPKTRHNNNPILCHHTDYILAPPLDLTVLTRTIITRFNPFCYLYVLLIFWFRLVTDSILTWWHYLWLNRLQCISCSKACRCSDRCTNKPFRKEKKIKVVLVSFLKKPNNLFNFWSNSPYLY